MLLQKYAQHLDGCPKTGKHRAGERREHWVVEDSIGCTALEGWERQGRVPVGAPHPPFSAGWWAEKYK